MKKSYSFQESVCFIIFLYIRKGDAKVLITLPYVHTQHGHIGFCTLLIGKHLENYVILGGGAVDIWAPTSCKLVVADFYSKFTVHAANRYRHVTQQFDSKHI